MPLVNDYVLLPQGTLPAPNDGIRYGRIIEEVFLAPSGRFNASARKSKAGWKITIYLEPPIVMEVPKSYVISTVGSTVLSLELVERPRELVGIFVAKGMTAAGGEVYINYGQVNDLGPEKDDPVESRGYSVKFRPLPDGGKLEDQIFSEAEITDSEVTFEQYILGLGVGVAIANPEYTAARFAEQLITFNKKSYHSSWVKKFKSVSIAPTTCCVLDKWLRPVEVDVDTVLAGYTGLEEVIDQAMGRGVKAPEILRSLGNEFEAFCISNESVAGPPEVKVGVPGGPHPTTPPMQARNAVRQAVRQTTTQVAAAGGPASVVPMPDATYDPSSLKHQQVANKLAYVPTESQMHKHSVTFRSGVYGKSSTRVEHMAGVEIVFEEEVQLATTRAMAQIRSICVMQGSIHLVPLLVWESCDAVAFKFEENAWEPIKWTKSPEVVLTPVDDYDHFWRLYNQMQLAAARYYVEGYGRVLEHVKQNLMAGLLQFGGKEQFDSLRRENRITTLQCAVNYMRSLVGKYLNEILLQCSTIPVIQWLTMETTQSPMFYGLVSRRWQTIHLQDVRSAMASASTTAAPSRPKASVGGRGQPDEERTPVEKNPLAALKQYIPMGANGSRVCLVDFTNKGCRNKDCIYSPRTPAMGQLDVRLQRWLERNHGSYKK